MTANFCTGLGGGQSWDPFRPLHQSSVLQQSLSATDAAAAYTRESSSKLVLQHRSLDAKTLAVHSATKQDLLAQRKPAFSLAKAVAPNSGPAAVPDRRHPTVTARPAQTASRASSGRFNPSRGDALQGRQPKLQGPSRKCIARSPVRRPARTWKRQSQGTQSGTKQAAPKAVSASQTISADQAGAQGEASHASAAQRHPTSLQGWPRSPKFVRRRMNQLVRLSSPSAARSPAHLLCSGMH